MAHSAHATTLQLTEVIDAPNVLSQKIEQLADLFRSSRRIVFLTGAGMSTACGIRDYRSGKDTCVKTGMGTWTEKALKQAGAAAASPSAAAAAAASAAVPPPSSSSSSKTRRHKRKAGSLEVPALKKTQKPCVATAAAAIATAAAALEEEYDEEFERSVLAAVPSYAHLALVELYKRGKLRMLITQNTDALHAMSGLPSSVLCEIHGNSCLEECLSCHALYRHDALVVSQSMHARLSSADLHRKWLRHLQAVDPCNARVSGLWPSELDDTDPEADQAQNDSDTFSTKYTGRFCPAPSCRAPLVDNIVEFGESLYNDELKRCEDAGKQSDLLVVMGTSVVVDPIRKIVYSKLCKRGRVVLINLQLTALERDVTLSIHGPIDDVFRGLMGRLGLSQAVAPTFVLQRFVRVEQKLRTGPAAAAGAEQLEIRVAAFVGPEEGSGTLALFKDVSVTLPVRCSRPIARSLRSRGSIGGGGGSRAAAAASSSSCSSSSPPSSSASAAAVRAPPPKGCSCGCGGASDFFEVLPARRVEAVTGAHTFVVQTLDMRPMREDIRDRAAAATAGPTTFGLTLKFRGHKQESDVDLSIEFVPNHQILLELAFDTSSREWLPLSSAPVVTPLKQLSSTRRSRG